MIKSYEQFKSKIFNNKDQLRDMLNILYNVDKLRPMVIELSKLRERRRTKKGSSVVQLNKRKDCYDRAYQLFKKIKKV